ncbi:MAG: AAA family ATPase [Anaerolineae bacterium]|nr:AAA family ATPase [Anaerolineae bacterium]
MEFAAILRLLRRWLWLIALLTIVIAAVRFVQVRAAPPVYESTTKIQIGSFNVSPNPQGNFNQIGQQLGFNYIALVRTYPVLEATVRKLGLPFSPESLNRYFEVSLLENTSLLEIRVTYTDPIVVADIANELATQLILASPTSLTVEQQKQLDLLRTEAENAQQQLENARSELATIEQELRNSPTPEREQELNTRRDQLNSQITAVQANLANLSNTIAVVQQQSNSNTLTVVERARIPTEPRASTIVRDTILAALIGGTLASLLAFGLEYLNDSARNPGEIQPLTGQPLIGTIPPFGKKGSYGDRLVAWTQPRSTFAEAYRALRVNLMYAKKDEGDAQRFVYIITSPNPSEGKSITTANLAITFANTGMRVLLIDADLRRPVQHLIFNLSNTSGLTNILSNATLGRHKGTDGDGRASEDFYQSYSKSLVTTVTQKTAIPGLDFIPAGTSPANPAELLGSIQMQSVMHLLSTESGYDVILFDTPPSLTVSDSLVLSNVVNGEVIVVIESGRTRRPQLVRVVQQFVALNIPVAGVVMNRLNPRDAEGGYGYYYYYYGYYGHDNKTSEAPTGNGSRPRPALPTNQRGRPEREHERDINSG